MGKDKSRKIVNDRNNENNENIENQLDLMTFQSGEIITKKDFDNDCDHETEPQLVSDLNDNQSKTGNDADCDHDIEPQSVSDLNDNQSKTGNDADHITREDPNATDEITKQSDYMDTEGRDDVVIMD